MRNLNGVKNIGIVIFNLFRTL